MIDRIRRTPVIRHLARKALSVGGDTESPTERRRRLVRAAAVHRRAGEYAHAMALVREAVIITPGERGPIRELIRCIHASAQDPADLQEALILIRGRLATDPGGADFRLAIDHAIATIDLGSEEGTAVSLVVDLGRHSEEQAAEQIRRFTTFLIDTGRDDAAVSILARAAGVSEQSGLLVTLAYLHLQRGAIDEALSLIPEIEARSGQASGATAYLRSDAYFAVGDVAAAEAVLDELPRTYPAAHSTRLVALWKREGRFQYILDHLTQTWSGLTETTRAQHLFDTYWALGQRQEAALALERVPPSDNQFPGVVSRIELLEGADTANNIRVDLIQAFEADPGDDAGLLSAVQAAWAMNDPERMLALIRQHEPEAGLGPTLRYLRSQALYALRRFDEASTTLATLHGTNQTWAAGKLQARIMLESGQFAEAENLRRAAQRPNDGHDEALYHALLAQRHWREAFDMDPLASQLADLRAMLPAAAEARPMRHVSHRFVIADAGPGDEIQDASLYDELAQLSDQLTVTCDPRLKSLFARSFPTIDFVPVKRCRTNEFGDYNVSEPTRCDNVLHPLLTADAFAGAREADSVVLGRGVKSVRDLSNGPDPAAPYLVALPGQRDAYSHLRDSTSPTIGLVWRSEMRSLMRDIHYTRLTDLAPLFDLGARLVCLQHDMTDAERQQWASLPGEKVELNDVNLRDDFERAAGVVSNLDLVIGIGTTMTNLAAALGVRTLMAQPTHFGSWMATGDNGQSFWYQTCDVVVAQPPTDQPQLVERLTARATEVLGLAK